MAEIVCVSGDSFTHEYLQKYEDKWSTQIGATHNIARGGAGNDRIFNETIKFLNETTPNTLIIGWSSTARGSLYHSKGSRILVMPSSCHDEETGENYEDIKKFYYTNLHNEYINFTNALHYMIFIQDYCKARNIKLRYFRSVMAHELDHKSLMEVAESAYMNKGDLNIKKQGIKHNYNHLIKLIDKLDKDIWIKEFWYSMSKHIEQNFPGSCKPGHVLPVQAVNDWAELVKKYL